MQIKGFGVPSLWSLLLGLGDRSQRIRHRHRPFGRRAWSRCLAAHGNVPALAHKQPRQRIGEHAGPRVRDATGE